MPFKKQTFRWIAKTLVLMSIFVALPMSVQAMPTEHCNLSTEHLSSVAPMPSDEHCLKDLEHSSAQSTCAEQSCHCGHLFLTTTLPLMTSIAKPTNHFQSSFRLQPSQPQVLYRPPQLT